MSANDGNDVPAAPRAFARAIQSFAGPLVQPTPPPSVLSPICPDRLPRPPQFAHLFQFFGAPLVPAPAPASSMRPILPGVLSRPSSFARTFQHFAGPTANSIGSFIPFGPAGAATLVLSLQPGTRCTYSWHTDIFRSYSGLEQRCNTTGPAPRQRFEGQAFLLDAASRDLRTTLQRAAAQGSTFLLALPYEELVTTADSSGTILTVATTTQSDWAIVTQRVMLIGNDETTLSAVIQAVTPTQIRLDVTPGAIGKMGARVMPLIQVLLDPQQGFARYPVNVDTWSIRATANVFGWVGADAMGVGVQIVTYTFGAAVDQSTLVDDDLIIWDRPNYIEGTAADSMISGAELVDLGALPFAQGGANVPDWARPIMYSSNSITEWQWVKAFLRQTLGRQRSFLLPTNRADLLFVSSVVETLKVESASGDYTTWYASQSHRRLALTKSNGSIQYVTVTDNPTDNGDGTLSLTLDAAVTGAVARISFLEQVRFDNNDSDDFSVTWDGGTFSVDFLARTTEEVIVPPALPLSPEIIVSFNGDSICFGQGNPAISAGEYPLGAFESVTSDGVIPIVTLDRFAAPAENDPPTFTHFGPIALQAYDAGHIPGYGAELQLGRTFFAIGGWTSGSGYLTQRAISGVFTFEWDPGSTYMLATTGKNLYNTWRDQALADQTATGRKLGIVVFILGTNDANNGTFATAVGTHAGNIVTQIGIDFPAGANWSTPSIVFVMPHVDTTNTFTAQVRASLLTYAGMAPSNVRVVSIDRDAAIGIDGVHPDSDSYHGMGQLIGLIAGDMRGIPRRVVAGPAPEVVGFGVPAHGSGNLAVRSAAETQDGDTEHLVCLSGGFSAGTIDTPAGWTLKASGSSTAVGVTEQYVLFERQVNAADLDSFDRPAPVAVTFHTSTENYAQRFTLRGPNLHPMIDVAVAFTDPTAGVAPNVFGTGSYTVPSATASVDHTRVIRYVGGFNAGAGGGVTLTDPGLTLVAEIKDASYQLPDTGYQLASATSGVCDLAGPTGVASVTFATSTLPAIITAIVKP